MEDLRDIQPFVEMSNKDLFCVLTGDRGIMAQYELQKIVKAYLETHEEEADLHTMVETVLKEEQ